MNRLIETRNRNHRARFVAAVLLLTVLSLAASASAQTAATGALTGTIADPTGAVLPSANVKVTNEVTSQARTVTTQSSGVYTVPLLPPGRYHVEITQSGFKTAARSGVDINVTETTRLDVQLEVGAATETVTIESSPAIVQTESSALGRVINEKTVVSLPLVTRNYTQIIALSPGITADVTNAAELGRGRGGLSAIFSGGTFVHGARAYDNNFQMNGVGINDFAAQDAESGGVAIPNPDTIQEFKVQTGQYDAAYGRNAGANVNLITKGGGNDFHGNLFEFFRNNALNANDFFFNSLGQKKPVLRQNQFGGTLGGPLVKDKLLFFGSYQGTRA
ncbi:MAG: carboxypeptidase regulatory-like domain-containing protein [Blastocatellia bacterium]